MATSQKATSQINMISVVIPTFKRPGLALKAAQTIRKFHKDIEIIIVDQESETPISEKDQKKLQITYINLKKANTAKAKNTGLKHAHGEIIFFFDDDIEITKDTISKQLEQYRNPNVIGTCGRVINDGETVPKETHVDTGKTNMLATKFTFYFWSTKKQTIDFPYGCNMSFRKKILEKIGGFDEGFPKIFEEIDLGVRARKYGDITFVPEALAYHHKAQSGGTRSSIEEKLSLIYKTYGYYMAKRVLFPFSLITLLLRTRTVLSEAPFAVNDLFKGYVDYCRKWITPKKILIILIFGGLIFSRFWKIPEFFTFNFDEEYQANLAWQQVKDFHPIWIGVSASNVNYYLGPGITYLNAALFWLSKGDPVILGYFSFFLGLATIYSLYITVKDLFSEKVAVFASLFYAGGALYNFYDRRFWNPSPVPFISIWMFYALTKVEEKPKYWIVIALLFGISLHVHLSLLIFTPVILYKLFKTFKKNSFKIWIPAILIYLLVTAPMLVYDVNHNFDNLLFPFKFLQNSDNPLRDTSSSNFWSHFVSIPQIFQRIWFLGLNTNLQREFGLGPHAPTPNTMWPLSILSVLILFFVFYKSLQNKYLRLLSAVYVLFLLAYIFYPGGIVEYFILGFIALFSIAVGVFLSNIPNFISYSIIAIFLIANLAVVFTSTQPEYGLVTRKKLIQNTMTYIKDQSFFLETVGRDPRAYHPYGGWRHLFRIYGKTPTQSTADPEFGWIYPDEVSNEKPALRVIISEDIPYNPRSGVLYSTRQGAYYVYVIKNP